MKFVFLCCFSGFLFLVAFNKRLRHLTARSLRGYREEDRETIEAVTMSVALIAGMFFLALAFLILTKWG